MVKSYQLQGTSIFSSMNFYLHVDTLSPKKKRGNVDLEF